MYVAYAPVHPSGILIEQQTEALRCAKIICGPLLVPPTVLEQTPAIEGTRRFLFAINEQRGGRGSRFATELENQNI
jgi:hypothetical protein